MSDVERCTLLRIAARKGALAMCTGSYAECVAEMETKRGAMEYKWAIVSMYRAELYDYMGRGGEYVKAQ